MADFDLLRDSARTAVLPTAESVRARGHQRTVRSRTLYGGLAALILVGGASLAATRAGDDRSSLQPGQTPSPVVSTAPTTQALTPGITMEVRRTSAEGAGRVLLEAHVTGAAPAVWSKRQARFLVEEQGWQLRHKAVWGNGQESSANDPDLECRDGAPLVPVDTIIGFENPYTQKGTYTITVSVTGCGLSEELTTEAVVTEKYVPQPQAQGGASLELTEVSRSGFRWSSEYSGTARQAYEASGRAAGDARTAWALLVDGTSVDGVDDEGRSCRPGAPLTTSRGSLGGRVERALTPGRHTVTIAVQFCSDEGKVSEFAFSAETELVVP